MVKRDRNHPSIYPVVDRNEIETQSYLRWLAWARKQAILRTMTHVDHIACRLFSITL